MMEYKEVCNCNVRIAGDRLPSPCGVSPRSNTVSKQSRVYPRLAHTDRVVSRLWGALTVPIIFVTGIAPKPIPASSPPRRGPVPRRRRRRPLFASHASPHPRPTVALVSAHGAVGAYRRFVQIENAARLECVLLWVTSGAARCAARSTVLEFTY